MRVESFGTQFNTNHLSQYTSGKNVFSLAGSASLYKSHMPQIQRFKLSDLNKEFDVIVIGGGINGSGIARDLASRDLSVLLLEKDDFSSGCTGASTRLIHGGLRYLEHFEFSLVRESLREREILLKKANHLVHPIQFCLPVYKTDKRPFLFIKLGMWLYDLLSYDKSLPWHKIISKSQVKSFEPALVDDNLLGAAVFYDSQITLPERLTVENILMAKENGALALNHAEVCKLNIEKNKIASVEFYDHLTSLSYTARGKVVINASGPWIDNLCGLSNLHLKRRIGGTKGSHIIIKQFPDGPKHALLLTAKSDGRPFFIIPWQEYYLIGTTDIPFEGDLDKLKISESEIDYLISEANNVLKNKKITKSDILFTYSGVRPLPYAPNIEPGSISRRHFIVSHKNEGLNNLYSIVGGKLSTYRNLSEEVGDKVINDLGYPYKPTITRSEPLIGALPSDIDKFKKYNLKRAEKKYELDQEIISHLIDLYGKRYKDVLDATLQNRELGKLLGSHALDIRAQVQFSFSEMAYTISDVIHRLSLGLNEGLGEEAISEIAKMLQLKYGYDTSQVNKQVTDYYEKIFYARKISDI